MWRVRNAVAAAWLLDAGPSDGTRELAQELEAASAVAQEQEPLVNAPNGLVVEEVIHDENTSATSADPMAVGSARIIAPDGPRAVSIGQLTDGIVCWQFSARVTAVVDPPRSDLRDGFAVDLVDRDGGEARAIFYDEAAVRFFDFLNVGEAYTFSGGDEGNVGTMYDGRKVITFFDESAVSRDVETPHQ